MSTILKAREDMLKKLNVMVRRIEGVTSFVLIGSAQCPPSDIHVALGCADDSAMSKIYGDINFLISEFLSPVSFDYREADGRIIKKYIFENQVNAEVVVCGENNFPDADWWVSYLDQNGAACSAYAGADKYMSDPVKDLPEKTEEHDDNTNNSDNAFSDDFEDDFEDDLDACDEPPQPEPQPEPQPIAIPPVVPLPDSVEEGKMVGENFDDFTIDEQMSAEETQPEQSDDELWEYIYGRVSLAKRAVAGGSIIHASEIVNELRMQLIKLICQKCGINEDYIHSIDLLSNEYQKKLVKTYPARLESGAVISALAAELSLFEQLIK